MPKNALRPVVCTEPGCGYVYTHKRMDSKVWKSEHFRHKATGECTARVAKFNERETASRDNGGITAAEVTEMMRPIYEIMSVQDAKIEALRARLERRLESRRKSHVGHKERDAKPKPWVMGLAVGSLAETDAHPVQSFRDIMTKDYENGWSWERALTQWFHWLLDQCSSDPIILMATDIRYHTKSGPVNTTKLRFFRCFASKISKWDPADEANDAFFVGFWYPLVRACRSMVHWENWIMFNLPITEQAKRHVESIWHDDMMDPRAPCLQRDSRIAQVFYDVLVERKDMRRTNRMDDEKEQP